VGYTQRIYFCVEHQNNSFTKAACTAQVLARSACLHIAALLSKHTIFSNCF
jgi:hypothetical protein